MQLDAITAVPANAPADAEFVVRVAIILRRSFAIGEFLPPLSFPLRFVSPRFASSALLSLAVAFLGSSR